MRLEELRREYRFAELNRKNVKEKPIDQLKKWLGEAQQAGTDDFTAMNITTCIPGDFPTTRIVLLKDISSNGLTFFTNYNSSKAYAIESNNKVSLHFFWSKLDRQVRINGFAQKTSRKVSETYFKSRPFESQLAAIASNQSEEISDRKQLEACFVRLKEKYIAKKPQCPENWGGFLIQPVYFEFWQGRENRLHDRIAYMKHDDDWQIKRLAP